MTIVASSPITSWQIDDEETMETVTDLFSWSPKPLQMVTAAMKLWKACSLGKKLWQTCEVKITQLCLPLCDPMDYTILGILQARILEWVTFPFSRGSSQPRDWTQVSCMVGGFLTSWATREVQEYWVGVAYPFSRGSSGPRNRTRSPALQADFLLLSFRGSPKCLSNSLLQAYNSLSPGQAI